MTSRSILAGALALAALVPARAAYLVQSRFDQDLDGWSVTHDAAALVWRAPANGSDGGSAEAADQATGAFWYWSAPPRFLGDKSTAYGETLSYRVWTPAAATPTTGEAADVALVGGGLSAVAAVDGPSPPGVWTDHALPLSGFSDGRPDTPWRLDSLRGPPVTAEQMQVILARLDALLIRGEYVNAPGVGRLDSVTMTLSEAPPITPIPAATDFNRGGDGGWTVFGDAQGGSSAPAYKSSGGVANTGYVQADDNAQGGVWYWSAPPKYLGNVEAAYGLSLSFALNQSSVNSQFSAPDVMLDSGETRLVYRFRHHPDLSWTPYTVPLAAGANWHVGDLAGPTPTEAEFRGTLGLLTGLYIRGEFVSGPDTGGLDNVVLGAPKLHDGDMDKDAVVGPLDVVWCLRRAAGLAPATYEDIQRGDLWPAAAGDMGDARLDIPDALEVARRME